MGMRTIPMTEITAILYRWVNGASQREIARSLGLSRNTVYTTLKAAKLYDLAVGDKNEEKILEVSQKIIERRLNLEFNRPTENSLKPHHEQIQQWLNMPYMTVKQIWRLLHEQNPSLKIGITSLHRYVRRHFQEKKMNSTMVLQTEPGEQAQVDFGYVGLMLDPISGKNRKTYAFVMTLSYSRHRFVYFTFRQDTATWIDCHKRAFAFFGGVPKTILLDNLKAGVLKADIYDPTLNPAYAECERYYGFIADPAKVRTPEHKGKVERSITIVKQQVVSGREHQDINQANLYAMHWSSEIIANEVTRTTGETPKVLFECDEKSILLPLPEKPFECPAWAEAKVGRDQHVTYQGSFYSIPEQYVGQTVSVRATLTMIRFYYQNVLIKAHPAATRKGQWQTDVNDLKPAAQHYLENTPASCLDKANAIGEATYQVIKKTLSRQSTSTLRKAQAILRLAETYTPSRLEVACQRAITFDNTEYKTLQNILAQGLDKLLPESAPQYSYAALSEGAYLREPSEFTFH